MDDSSNGYSACRDTSAMGYHYPTVNYRHQDLPTNSAVTSSLQAQTASSSTPQVYQQPGFHGYSAASMPAVGGAAALTTPGRMGGYPGTASLDEAYASYQSTLKKIFQNIRDAVLVPASDSLLEASGWLLSHVVELGVLFPNRMEHADRSRRDSGLTSDDPDRYAHFATPPRLVENEWKMWYDFNHAWLAMLQRQKEIMESGRPLQDGQTLVPKEGLRKMSDDLVRLCDSIKPYELVDYRHGVWREEIIGSRCGRLPLHECVLLMMCC